MTKAWHLEEGIYTVRALQPTVREFGYHITLGGSLLNKGYSDKDLDLYFLPMGGFGKAKVLTNQPDKLLAHLTSIWGNPKPIGKKLEEPAAEYHYKPFAAQERLAGGRPARANPNVPPDFARRARVANDELFADEEVRRRIDEEDAVRRLPRLEPQIPGHWLDPQGPAANQLDLEAAVRPIPRPRAEREDQEIEDAVFKKLEKNKDYEVVGIYKHAVTFYRNGTERIDCFIF